MYLWDSISLCVCQLFCSLFCPTPVVHASSRIYLLLSSPILQPFTYIYIYVYTYSTILSLGGAQKWRVFTIRWKHRAQGSEKWWSRLGRLLLRVEKIRSRNKRNGEGREEREEQEDEEENEEEEVAMVAMVVPVVVLRTRGTKWRGENSARRSSAAITGCQLAKKSNARFPSLCDAMLMACRCLFSTRCLHTWLDPRGISEMFLAPIRNHIQLLSSLSNSVFSLSLFLSVSLVAAPSHVHDRLSLTPTTSPITFPCFQLFRSNVNTYTRNELTVN